MYKIFSRCTLVCRADHPRLYKPRTIWTNQSLCDVTSLVTAAECWKMNVASAWPLSAARRRRTSRRVLWHIFLPTQGTNVAEDGQQTAELGFKTRKMEYVMRSLLGAFDPIWRLYSWALKKRMNTNAFIPKNIFHVPPEGIYSAKTLRWFYCIWINE